MLDSFGEETEEVLGIHFIILFEAGVTLYEPWAVISLESKA